MLLMSNNISSTFFNGPKFSELLRIARCLLRTNDFIPRASDLFQERCHKVKIDQHCLKNKNATFHRYQKLVKTLQEISISIMKNN